MIFFGNNLCYIKFFSEMYYHVFSTKADQKGGSIHKEKNLFTEIHILVLPCLLKVNSSTYFSIKCPMNSASKLSIGCLKNY